MIRKRLFILLVCVGFGVFFIAFYDFYFNNKSYLRLPIIISSTFGIPILKIEIEGIQYPVEVDLGMAYQLDVNSEVLRKIKNKKRQANTIQRDIRGDLYEIQSFRIPSVRFKHWEIKDIVVSEENPSYVSNTIFGISSEKIKKQVMERDAKIRQGSIGWPIFAQFACFFDFAHSEIIIGKNMDSLFEAGLSINEFIKVPFSLDKGGLILSVATDLGTNQFLLDTGFSCSVIRQRLAFQENIEEYTSRSMLFSGQDLGQWTFKLFEISDFYHQFDGILGVDFFKKHAICLDFQSQTAYIQPMEKQ